MPVKKPKNPLLPDGYDPNTQQPTNPETLKFYEQQQKAIANAVPAPPQTTKRPDEFISASSVGRVSADGQDITGQGSRNVPQKVAQRAIAQKEALQAQKDLQQAQQPIEQGQAQQPIEQGQAQPAPPPQPINQTSENAQQPGPQQDNRGLFMKTFFPTAEEGAARRLKSFGTTSKVPAIAAGITAGAAAGIIGAAAIPTLLGAGAATGAAGSAAATTTAAGSLAAGTGLSAKFLGGALLAYVGSHLLQTYHFINSEMKQDVRDDNGALALSLTGAETSLKDFNAGGITTSDDVEAAISQAESNIAELDKGIKIYSHNPLANVSRYKQAIINAQDHIIRLRRALLISQVQDRLRNAQQRIAQ